MGVSIRMLVQRSAFEQKVGRLSASDSLVHMLEFHVNIVKRQHKSDLYYVILFSQEG